MIKQENNSIKVMEFTKFKKAEHVTNEDLIAAAMNFESTYLSQQNGIVLHCLVRNLNGEFANVLLADSMESLKNIEAGFNNNEAVGTFMQNIDTTSVKVHYHQILKPNFVVPENFTCIEHGTFSPKENTSFSEEKMLSISNTIESTYLEKFDNSLAHFMGKIDDTTYSEIAFGKTLGKTREICFGYFGFEAGQELINLYQQESVDLDFWYLIA